MKIFFTASYTGKKEFGELYDKIDYSLKEMGYPNMDNTLASLSADAFYSKLKKEGKKGYEKLFHQSIAKLKQADINIFECSYQSFAIGYMIQKSLEVNKPTVVLYLKDYHPYFLEGVKNEKFQILEYTGADLKQKLQKAIEKALNLREKRFNFFISPDLLTYLEEASKKEGLTKSTFIRNLILQHKKKSKN